MTAQRIASTSTQPTAVEALAQWFDATRLLWRAALNRSPSPDPSLSQAARVLSEHAHAARRATEATIAERKAAKTEQLRREMGR